MSILQGIAGFFNSAGSAITGVARAAWHAVAAVWAFLVNAAHMLDGAWDWVVHGVEWMASQVEGFAGELAGIVWHILTSAIPEAVAWVAVHVWHLAAAAVARAYNTIRSALRDATRWLSRLIAHVEHLAHGLFHAVTHWATGAVDWVAKVGQRVWWLLSHPERMVKWIVGSLAGPLVKWILKSGAPIVAWLLRGAAEADGEIAHFFEDVIARML